MMIITITTIVIIYYYYFVYQRVQSLYLDYFLFSWI